MQIWKPVEVMRDAIGSDIVDRMIRKIFHDAVEHIYNDLYSQENTYDT